jgi:hypothetical protein
LTIRLPSCCKAFMPSLLHLYIPFRMKSENRFWKR